MSYFATKWLAQLYNYRMKRIQPTLKIGILKKSEIHFELFETYTLQNIPIEKGTYAIRKTQTGFMLNQKEYSDQNFILVPQKKDSIFTLHEVKIGIGFHWEQNETQSFKGALQFTAENDQIWAVNHITIEDYIKSVVSSEMNANAPIEFIKAHAIISRSWALAQLNADQHKTVPSKQIHTQTEISTWYDKDNHTLFDLCADDHCQRYQGVKRITNKQAIQAVDETYSMVLTNNKVLCDTRFSKCCGGISEDFENVWQPEKREYLSAIWDGNESKLLPNLTNENDFALWLKDSPKTFCNTADKKVLAAVLNDYDQTTNDFFRWNIKYSAEELTALVLKKSGIDFGTIKEISPLERGRSGRIIRLTITGEKTSRIIGKELEIRRIFSEKHLYSSAFTISKIIENNTTYFQFQGAGWGHGVGLCQIGAAAMGISGYKYNEILLHYFKNTEITKWYE